ncbi:LLM class flavin-dependent oxidoreductase [Candidatus Nitrosocosmicus franklandus]|uniref:Luciferase-like monooxygenase family protein n=1 Tax=Candidatus Nitrosocosmicus franklandianus TaxID=1798806 RepID=A0A484IFB9_9ARCH|nr:LLM class flavin-dependent oxidoreductase [Candidatus Nitrosocosmicus franklandus]VFJ15478.1 luciferase-like monooxygenase family protein [Candidatus Nitrosocosmicus franklandus]
MKNKIAFSTGSLLNPKQVLDFSSNIDANKNVHSLWTPESWGKEAFSILGAISQVTKRIKIGTSIINIYTRTPATICMGAITLDLLSEHRVILGLGTSTPPLIENLHGLKFNNPVQRMREYIESIRLLLRKGKTSYDGRIVKITNFELLDHSRKDIPIFVAAVNPRMLNLSKEIADGVILYLKPKDEMETIARQTHDNKNGKSFTKASVIITSVYNRDPSQAVKRAARTLVFYISVGKIYYDYLLNTRHCEIIKKIYTDYHKFGIEEALKNIKTEILDDFVIAGSINECISQIKAFRRTGIDLPILQVNPILSPSGSLSYKDFFDL